MRAKINQVCFKKMEYFGTTLDQHGHCRFILGDVGMVRVRCDSEKLPFHPECITQGYLKNGDVVFYQGGGLTVIGICGSCKDSRSGSKSIFWVNELITREEMIQKIKKQPMAMKIISAMPFEVKWNPI